MRRATGELNASSLHLGEMLPFLVLQHQTLELAVVLYLTLVRMLVGFELDFMSKDLLVAF